jgi:hypothetical protein
MIYFCFVLALIGLLLVRIGERAKHAKLSIFGSLLCVASILVAIAIGK